MGQITNKEIGALLILMAGAIAVTGHNGWGWFLFAALFTL